MFLHEVLSIIGFTKIQQISLIKILFLTGSLSFLSPNSFSDLRETIEINRDFLESEINEVILFDKGEEELSDKKAEEILEKAEFKSKEHAFNWLNSIMQRKFFRGQKERFETEDKYKNNLKLAKLIQNFHFNDEVISEGKFDAILLLGCNEKGFESRVRLLSKELKKGEIDTSYIYFLTAERVGFPYREPSIESILAERLSQSNNRSFEENLKSVRKIFIKVAMPYIESFKIKAPSNLDKIKEIFEENSQIYNINYLISSIRSEELLKEVPWPTESDISKRYIPKDFYNYELKIVSSPNEEIEGKIVRADTKKGAVVWLKEFGEKILSGEGGKKRILIVSSQPHAHYQRNVFKSILGDKFEIEVIASSSENKNISILLSELSAIIYASKELVLKDDK